MTIPEVAEVSAVICTMNSIASIQACLESLRNAGVGQVIVVDAMSTDGTRQIAESLADLVVTDPGQGLGKARNIGIERCVGRYILNLGSDNVVPAGQIDLMLRYMAEARAAGVSACTRIAGSTYAARGLDNWRRGKFVPGPAKVIGTPTLFEGDMLRANPYDESRQYSDDSELCERWTREFGAQFAISDAYVLEQGKTSWQEVLIRCRMYGISDFEVYSQGRVHGWSLGRKLKSLLHPARVDLVQPARRLDLKSAVYSAPFLLAFTALRYFYWAQAGISHAAGRA